MARPDIPPVTPARPAGRNGNGTYDLYDRTPVERTTAERIHSWPFTVDQYHHLIKAGILPEGKPYELLDGQLVRKDRSATGADPVAIGHLHAWVVGQLADLNPKLRRLGAHIRTQQPITLPPFDEPEPNAALVIGKNGDYVERHPGAAEVTCVIEVADASLRRDRTSKLRVYADGGIARYVIINVPDRVIEVYTNPVVGKGTYGTKATLTKRDRLELPAAKANRLAVGVKQLLPG